MVSTTSAHVSILIPVYNDPGGIQHTLDSVISQKGVSYEVIVVDNGSIDATREVIRDYVDKHEHVKLLVEDEKEGSYAARNKGIQQATGEVLAFLDADETIEDDWLTTALAALERQEVDYLGCNVQLTNDSDTVVGRYNMQTGFPVREYLETEQYAPTCALLVRRTVFEEVGLFESRLISGGDVEFGQRVAASGYNQGYAEDAVVTHPARTSLSSLGKKNFRVGRGFCQKQRYYPDRYGQPGCPPAPSGPGINENQYEAESLITRFVFVALSLLMLSCRAAGYYYEFFFGKECEATR